MSRHFSVLEFDIRTEISDQIQALIDKATEHGNNSYFIAGLEVALAVVTGAADARPEGLKDAEQEVA